jgi:hypothetical protein
MTAVCTLEGRPQEQGRNVIVRASPDGTAADITPAGFNTAPARMNTAAVRCGGRPCRPRLGHRDRAPQKSPPGQGGWHMYHNGIYGVDPTNKMIHANGELAQNG